MKALLVAALAACTSARQLASPADPRLRTPGHVDGWVVTTTEPWRERIDPNTELRFKGDGGWSEALAARDLRVDAAGAWVDREEELSAVIERVRIEHIEPAAMAQLDTTRPDHGKIEIDARGVTISAPPAELTGWLDDLELAIARLDPAGDTDDAKLETLRVAHASAPLGAWKLYSTRRGWWPMQPGGEVLAKLHKGLATRVGWRWDQMRAIEVRNLSGGKTLGAMVGYAAVTAALLPVALVLRGGFSPGNLSGGHGGGGGSGGGTPGLGGGGEPGAPPGTWQPDLPENNGVTARPLFTTVADVRAIAEPTLTLDGARSRDMISSGVIARVRLGQLFEIGGGVRELVANRVRSTTGAFSLGFHLPMDAGMRIALPLGFEVGGGGEIALDLRFPWGIRYNARHWFATVAPATPQYLHVHDQPARWSLASGAEVGVTF